MLNESRKVDLFKLDNIIILPIIKLFGLINVSIRLHYLIYPLFDYPHVRHHIYLSDSLSPKQLGILLTIQQVEYLLHTRHDRFDTPLAVVEVECEAFRLTLQLPQFHFHLLDVSAALDVLVGQICGVSQSLDFLGDLGDLGLEPVNVLGLVVDKLEETKVALFGFDELGD